MSKKKKKRKTSPNRQSFSQKQQQASQVLPVGQRVRLSQCMIVKNEEKNIEKALSWAKDIAFEQIVVDTGSTDRTVELAEKMGAKVYRFEWINDFSAAKNFAMNQAKGDWIAILDADEYMLAEDAAELIGILKKIHNKPGAANQYDAIDNSWVQLDDNNEAFAILSNRRIFRNSPELRYEGRIHEAIRIRNQSYDASNLKIMHTGYATSVFDATGKRERNLKLLRDENKRDPEDPNIMIYLADSIKAEGTEEAREEAEPLYLKALSGKRAADIPIKQIAYDFLIPRLSGDVNTIGKPSRKDEALKLCDDAIADLPDLIDYRYFRAVLNNQRGNYKAAWDDLLHCENAFTSGNTLPTTRVLLPNPLPLFFQQKMAAKGMGDEQNIIKSHTIVNSMLTEAKTQTDTLSRFIRTILVYGLSDDEALEELADVYDLKNPRDLMFIARAAKDCGAIGFMRKVMDMTQAVMG
jgi:glycosyltransferase involved in cell wall biosynthesis